MCREGILKFGASNPKSSLTHFPCTALNGRPSLIIMFVIAPVIFSGSALGRFPGELKGKVSREDFGDFDLLNRCRYLIW